MKDFDEKTYLQNLKELDVYGFTVVSGLLSSEEIKEYKSLVEEEYNKVAGVDYPDTPKRDSKDKILYNLQAKNKKFIDILWGDWTKRFYRDKLNDPFYRLRPASEINSNLMYFNARSSGQKLDLHIDSHFPYIGDQSIVMQYVFFLDDSTVANGCTIVVPGSHQSGKFTDRDLEKVENLEAKAGDLVIWDSRLWHGTRENKSGASRWALVATVGMWWVKPMMDIPRTITQETYNVLSNEQKAFLGFCSLPPSNEFERINTKQNYEFLKENVKDYFV
ncbi:phytanoyl-CoA dioxygenase family protein [Bacteriovorax sp. Seq25_V]|uniref:phytanoyl-CoA dioxygenase family protein n=1 Tax=Bacteriovorax sp. Seq25_V TaxID=1201288 RepID=UPI00038A2715|nr:phytanoyl-CoA dioxygenase family protein [Bacteriovorax sp. Seq25_V]EQC43382.1 phytanoyl-CoA dioxygenase PhyH [Bacteriovorax sp. Seq25_V]